MFVNLKKKKKIYNCPNVLCNVKYNVIRRKMSIIKLTRLGTRVNFKTMNLIIELLNMDI